MKIRKARLSKASNAANSIGALRKGEDIFMLTFGQFSLIDLIQAVIDQIGPADFILGSWKAAESDIETLIAMRDEGRLTRARMILDQSFQRISPELFAKLIAGFGDGSVRAMVTHCKFVVLTNIEWNIVITTSMNLNNNFRLENIHLSDDCDFARWFMSVVDAVFDEIPPAVRKLTKLNLGGVNDRSPYKELRAERIVRESVNEPRTSHQITKL